MDKSTKKERRNSTSERESRDNKRHRHSHHESSEVDYDDEGHRSRRSRREKSRERSEERDSRRDKRKFRDDDIDDHYDDDVDDDDRKRARVPVSESKRERRTFQDGQVENGDKGSRRRDSAVNCRRRDDPFSRLPDEVIVSNILSHFTLEEGAQYNILSRRWKKLWACTIGSTLVFAPDHLRAGRLKKSTHNKISVLRDSFQPMYDRHFRSRSSSDPTESIFDDKINRLRVSLECWISNIVQAYCRPELDELTVRFPFGFGNQDSIDRWVECAIKRGVTRLELDLRNWGKSASLIRYQFPKIEKLQGLLAYSGGLCNLRDVTLRHVIVSQEVIEFMLAHFPLERLSIGPTRIGKLSVCGPSVRLKTLEVVDCRGNLKISASSLTSLTYTGPESSLLLEHVPNLSELAVDEEFCSTFIPTCFLKGGYISQLRRLEFVMSEQAIIRSVNYPFEFPETLKLEELQIEIHGEEDACLLWPLLLIKAAPFLRKISIEYNESDDYAPGSSESYNELRDAANRVRHHQCLKTIELHGYCGEESELELAKHLLQVSETLELVLISPFYVDRTSAPIIRREAKTIAKWLPPWSKAKLVVL